jgi:hypothetical protein
MGVVKAALLAAGTFYVGRWSWILGGKVLSLTSAYVQGTFKVYRWTDPRKAHVTCVV